jgi:hypothetical protein
LRIALNPKIELSAAGFDSACGWMALYYETAAKARFIRNSGAYPKIPLPDGVSWAFCAIGELHTILFGEDNRKYLLGISSKGVLLGFSLAPKPDEPALIAFVRTNRSDKTFALSRSEVPEAHIEPLFQRIFAPTSGHLAARRYQSPMRNRKEAELQESLVAWARAKYPVFSILFFAVNNNCASPRAGAIAKRMGTLKGVSDLICAYGNGKHIGFALELKIPPNKPTEEQRRFLAALEAQGWAIAAIYSLEQGIEFIDSYMACAASDN